MAIIDRLHAQARAWPGRTSRRGAAATAVALMAALAAACGSGAAPLRDASSPPGPASAPPAGATPAPAELDEQYSRQFEALSPAASGAAVDDSFAPNARLDTILPIYEPKFVSAREADAALLDDELVMGLEIGGDARAYPVGLMRVREIVNDTVGGVPVLVTW